MNDMDMQDTGKMIGYHSQHNHSMHKMSGMTGHSNHSMDMSSMHMFFHCDLGVYMLFQSIYINTIGAMLGACVVTFILALLYEGLKVLREHLLKKAVKMQCYSSVSNPDTNSHDVVFSNNCTTKYPSTEKRIQLISGAHFIQTLLHILQVLLSYVLMLIFMTYSAWLCIAVVLGAGVGYFLFGWKRSIIVNMDMNDHCH